MPNMRDLIRTGIGVPVGVLAVLSMVVLPLPPIVLDVLFTFNIALSLVIVMAVFYVARPVEFGVFPTILLLATLLRIAADDEFTERLNDLSSSVSTFVPV